MKIFYINIFICFVFPMTFNTGYGTIYLDEANIIDNPFFGGFNKPKIQWIDWDSDGDDDLFLLDEDGSIKFFKNNGCFNSDCSFELITTSFQGVSNISWFYIADFNQDSIYEMMTQSSTDPNAMIYYENTYIDEDVALIPIDIVVDVLGDIVESDPMMIPTFADIDGDNDLDFFTGNAIGTVSFYENVGFSNSLPQFEFITNFWQEIYLVGSSTNQRHGASAINFIDLDEDDDLDLTWGDYFQQSLYIIVNNGDDNNPIMDIENITNQFPENDPIQTAGLNMPSFSDIDNDGDQDLFITVLSGAYGYQLTNNFFLYNNDDDFIYQTSNFIQTLDLLSDINPEFQDLDLDGDKDLIIGTDFDPTSFPWSGKVLFFENIGYDENEEPIWMYPNDNLIGDTEGNNFSPEFADLDFDGDLDMLIGDFNGRIKYYVNQSTEVEMVFVYIELLEDIDLSGYSTPELVDIDGDDDYDLFIGHLNGTLYYYENIGTKYEYDFMYVSNEFEQIDVNYRSNPKFYDFDADNDYDLFIGSGYQNIKVYENIGDNSFPNFIINNNYDIPYLGLNTSPEFYISENITGLISGTSEGGMYFLQFEDYIIGDVNNDMIINIFDIVLLIEYILNEIEISIPLSYLDINNDSHINIVDVILLVSLVLNR